MQRRPGKMLKKFLDNEFELSSLPVKTVCVLVTVYTKQTIALEAAAEKLRVPDPLVVSICPLEPSAVGNVIASLIVRDLGLLPTSTMAAEPSFFSV